jgi:hypothetical protein
MKGWTDLGSDVSWEDYGGKWGRKGPDGAWYVVRFDNLEDAMGRDAPHKFSCDVLRVDLRQIPEKEQESARRCVGLDLEEYGDPAVREVAQVEACVSYGTYAPLDNFEGDKYPARLRADARRKAEEYMRDAKALDTALDRPVNAIGSTARDFGRGDIMAGLNRYADDVAMGKDPGDNTAKNLMLKISHGILAKDLKKVDAWSKLAQDDPLAFLTGFMQGEQTGEVEHGDDYAEAFIAGQEWGVAAKAKRLPWPSWIKRG